MQGPEGPQGPQGEQGEALNWANVIIEHELDDAVYALAVSYLDPRDDRRYYSVFCSGFAAHYTSAIWTNAHCVDAGQELLDELAVLDAYLFVQRAGSIGGETEGFHPITDMWKHPDYDGTTRSEDVGLVAIEGEVLHVLNLLPREFVDDLSIGQPLGTIGFPGELDGEGGSGDRRVTPTFKDGVLSALRLRDGGEDSHVEVQYNVDATGGTSGSAVFDHNGWVIALNHAGIEARIPVAGGDTILIGVGSLDLGIRVDEAWDLIDDLEAGLSAPAQAPRQDYPHGGYQPFPANWNGETIRP